MAYTEQIEGLRDAKGVEKEVEVHIKELPGSIEFDFDNLFGRYFIETRSSQQGGDIPIGTAKALAIREGVEAIYWKNAGWDEKMKRYDLPEPKERNIPSWRDEERESLATKVIRLIVKHNDWLSQLQPYMAVFQNFAPSNSSEEYPTEERTEESSSRSVTSISGPTESPTVTESENSVKIGASGAPEV